MAQVRAYVTIAVDIEYEPKNENIAGHIGYADYNDEEIAGFVIDECDYSITLNMPEAPELKILDTEITQVSISTPVG